jgi:hypothetical protein
VRLPTGLYLNSNQQAMRKISSVLMAGLVVTALFTQCKKSAPQDSETETTSPADLASIRQRTMKEVLTAAKNPEFRTFVLNECLKQRHGDYNVYLEDVVAAYKGKPGFEKFTSALVDLIAQTKQLTNGREPLIFYPRAETIEEQRSANSRTQVEAGHDPIGVYYLTFNPDYSSPGYILNDGYTLTYYQDITEDYAWENDVWVIGEEEYVSPDNMVPAPEEDQPSVVRVNGEAEYGALIQLTDMNALEHWTSGKFEFRYVVASASGGTIKDRGFGKTKRKYFRDSRWHDYNDFIANWNLSNIGNWMLEGWVEEDGGNSTTTVSQSFPAPCTGCPTTNFSYTKQNKDQDMGRSMIQFTDNKSQVYNITYANIKRK